MDWVAQMPELVSDQDGDGSSETTRRANELAASQAMKEVVSGMFEEVTSLMKSEEQEEEGQDAISSRFEQKVEHTDKDRGGRQNSDNDEDEVENSASYTFSARRGSHVHWVAPMDKKLLLRPTVAAAMATGSGFEFGGKGLESKGLLTKKK